MPIVLVSSAVIGVPEVILPKPSTHTFVCSRGLAFDSQTTRVIAMLTGSGSFPLAVPPANSLSGSHFQVVFFRLFVDRKHTFHPKFLRRYR